MVDNVSKALRSFKLLAPTTIYLLTQCNVLEQLHCYEILKRNIVTWFAVTQLVQILQIASYAMLSTSNIAVHVSVCCRMHT